MMKKLTTVFALVALCATAAMATDTRVLTLGNNHEVLVDDANVFLFPSRIAQFPNLAVAEVGNYYFGNEKLRATGEGSSDIGRLGVNWKFGSDESPWVLGTYMFNNVVDPLFGAQTSVFSLADFDFDQLGGYSNRRIQLIYGRKLGNMNFGFNVGYTASGFVDDVAPTGSNKYDESASQIALAVGLSDQAFKWDAAVHVILTSFNQDLNGSTVFEADGGTQFGGTFRFFHSVNPQWTIVPNASFWTGSLGITYPDAVPANVYTEKWTSSGFMAGCGIHYMPSNNVLAVIQPGVMITNRKQEVTDGTDPLEEDKESFTSLPFFKLGVEGDVFSWLDARFGATSYWQSEKDEFTDGTVTFEDTETYASNQTYLGFGFNFGRLHVDTYTDPQLFLNGFNFISGRNTNMNFQLSALMELF